LHCHSNGDVDKKCKEEEKDKSTKEQFYYIIKKLRCVRKIVEEKQRQSRKSSE
jgi:hypothetical protein